MRLGFLAAAVLCAAPRVAPAQVRFERTGFRLTSIGEKMAVSGRVLDSRRRPLSSTNIRWRIADPAIASVTRDGIVTSRRVGLTKLWAVSGSDSASAIILVDQWAASFAFFPSVVRLDAVGAKSPLRIQVRDAAGHPISGEGRKTTTCRSLNERIAAFAQSGEVLARANGVTFVRCTDRGIADSVRIEVRQRVERATIADKGAFGARVVGDSFRLQLRATDRAGDVIRDVQATWASMNPTIVSVDPLTGMARSVGAGEARVVAQAGDVTDTVNVRVQPGVGMPVPVATVDSTSGLPIIEGPRSATLRIDAMYPFEGDTTIVKFAARDPSGTDVPNPDVTLRSSDTTIVKIIPGTLRAVPKKAGSAYIIGRFNSVVDSALVSVRARSARTVATIEDNAEASAFRRPSYDTAAARRSYADAMKRARDSIFDFSPIGRTASGRLISMSANVGQAAHSFSDSTGIETRAGAMYGGTLELAPLRLLKFSGDFRTGTLNSGGLAGGSPLTVTEVEGALTMRISESFALRGGWNMRAVREGAGQPQQISLQQWTFARASAIARFRFVGDAVSLMISGSILPFGTYTGYYDPQADKQINPDLFSLAGETGIEIRNSWGHLGLNYYVERFSFPKVGNSTRIDQFSALRLRFGLQID